MSEAVVAVEVDGPRHVLVTIDWSERSWRIVDHTPTDCLWYSHCAYNNLTQGTNDV